MFAVMHSSAAVFEHLLHKEIGKRSACGHTALMLACVH